MKSRMRKSISEGAGSDRQLPPFTPVAWSNALPKIAGCSCSDPACSAVNDRSVRLARKGSVHRHVTLLKEIISVLSITLFFAEFVVCAKKGDSDASRCDLAPTCASNWLKCQSSVSWPRHHRCSFRERRVQQPRPARCRRRI